MSDKKRSKLTHRSNQQSEMACAGCSSEEYRPKIFKLNIDCFDEIFEYLSLKDLHSLGQTYRTMQQVA